MRKNVLKHVLIILAALLLIGATVAVVIIATGDAGQSADDAKLEISATNLSFSDSVYIKYAVARENVSADDVTLLVWTEPQDEYVKGNEAAELTTVGTETIDGVECLIFNYTGLAANQMTDNVYAVAYAKVGETECYSAPKKYSILQYAYNKMGKTGTATDNDKLKALLEDMLEYGALAQKYTGYKTDRLANADFYGVTVWGGVLEDGFANGLYLEGDTITLKAPAENDGFDFSGWANSANQIVSEEPIATITVGASNETYTALYQGPYTESGISYIRNEDGTYFVSAVTAEAGANVVIPSVINNMVVTGIGDGAFKGCTDVKSVTISKNITYIGEEAFSGCSSLDAIYYAGSEYEWSRITKGTDWNLNTGACKVYYAEGNDDWELGGVPLG